MTDTRTVLDVLRPTLGWQRSHGDPTTTGTDWTAHQIAVALGVNPDMPFEQFQRWLHYGKIADEMESGTPPDIESEVARAWFAGGNCVIDAIKGDS